MKKIIFAGLVSVFITHNALAETVEFSAEDFGCLTDMTPVRGFFVDNLLGNLDATLEAAKAPNGAVYPVGSVVQLIPTEVMVKREKGFNAATKDWEFVELKVSEAGSDIHVRGTVEVVNQFGGNCFACHVQARPEWDMICEQDHGCAPILLPDGSEVTQELIKGLQKTDPRCAVEKV